LVGPQLLEAIKPLLEDRWSPEISSAWTLLMENIAYAMKAAMRLQMKQA
jgi:hemoglobin-like flavoprotein